MVGTTISHYKALEKIAQGGWSGKIVPPPKHSTKSGEEFRREREEKVRWLIKHEFLRSEQIIEPSSRQVKVHLSIAIEIGNSCT